MVADPVLSLDLSCNKPFQKFSHHSFIQHLLSSYHDKSYLLFSIFNGASLLPLFLNKGFKTFCSYSTISTLSARIKIFHHLLQHMHCHFVFFSNSFRNRNKITKIIQRIPIYSQPTLMFTSYISCCRFQRQEMNMGSYYELDYRPYLNFTQCPFSASGQIQDHTSFPCVP